MDAVADVTDRWTGGLNLFQPIRILAFTAASAAASILSKSPRQQNSPTNSSFALAPISTPVRPALVSKFKQPLQINDYISHHFRHATLYTTALPAHKKITIQKILLHYK